MCPHASWFGQAWAASGKKLDMGEACLRFKRVEGLALDVLGQTIRRVPAQAYIARYLEVLSAPRPKRARAAK